MMVKLLGCLVILAVGLFLGYFIAVANIEQPEPAMPDAPITLDVLEKQCELTFHTRKGSKTFVPVTKQADEIINQIKGADSVPNGIHTSYYDIKGLTYNGYNVYAITGFMPEGVK